MVQGLSGFWPPSTAGAKWLPTSRYRSLPRRVASRTLRFKVDLPANHLGSGWRRKLGYRGHFISKGNCTRHCPVRALRSLSSSSSNRRAPT